MKCSELLRNLTKSIIQVHRQGKGSHIILVRQDGDKFSFPDGGSKEIAKGIEMKIKKMDGVKVTSLINYKKHSPKIQ